MRQGGRRKGERGEVRQLEVKREQPYIKSERD